MDGAVCPPFIESVMAQSDGLRGCIDVANIRDMAHNERIVARL